MHQQSRSSHEEDGQFGQELSTVKSESQHRESTTHHQESKSLKNVEEDRSEYSEWNNRDQQERTGKNSHFSGAYRVTDRAAASEHYMSAYKYTEEGEYRT
jgi:hypothetical protein